MTNEIIIKGRPISKKNSKRLVPIRGRMIPICSKAFLNFRDDALQQLSVMRIPKNIPPYSVSYRFMLKGRLDADLDNLIAGINDILQEAGIIDDDKNITHISAVKISGCEEWESVISIN